MEYDCEVKQLLTSVPGNTALTVSPKPARSARSRALGPALFGFLAISTPSHGTSLNIQQFVPQNRVITPFGYGTVRQQLIGSTGKTGAQWCTALWGPQWQCISVSGGNSCSGSVPVGELVSCNAAGTPPVDETAFQPPNCNGRATGPVGPLGSDDWCLIAGFQPSRTQDTLYLYNDYVRVGLNRRFGGAIFELYGTDKQDRILQAGGGALQLSLWGDDTSFAPAGSTIAYFRVPTSTTACDPTPYSSASTCEAGGGSQSCQQGLVGLNDTDCHTQFACIDNGAAAGAPINPIQAISGGCGYGVTGSPSGDARISGLYSPQANVVMTIRRGPQQFTKSSNQQVANLVWSTVAHVVGPFALASYTIQNSGTVVYNPDFQEIPALFTHQGFSGGSVYYYSGPAPYSNPESPVTEATPAASDASVQVYQLPNRTGPFGTGIPTGHGALLSEDWVSLCDSTQTKCLTVFSTSPDAQDIIYTPGDYAYFGIHGFFGIGANLNKNINVWVAPYRFDDVVKGQSVRSWLYLIRQSYAYAKPVQLQSFLSKIGATQVKVDGTCVSCSSLP